MTLTNDKISGGRKTAGLFGIGTLIIAAPFIGTYYVYGNDIKDNKEQIATLDNENAAEHQRILSMIPNKEYLDLRFKNMEDKQTEVSQDIRALTQEIRSRK